MTSTVAFSEVRALSNLSNAWNNNQIPEETMLSIMEIVCGNIKSNNKEDQAEQKVLWTELMELTLNETDPLEDFDEWIMSDIWTTDKQDYPVRFATLHPILHFFARSEQAGSSEWRMEVMGTPRSLSAKGCRN